MRRLAPLLLGSLALAPAAHGAPPAVSVQAAPAQGPAPLTTTLTATGDAVTYRWELPGGVTANGPSVTHVFPAGRHVVTVVGTNAQGEETRTPVTVTALTLSLTAPQSADFATRVRLRGRLFPALRGTRLTVYRNGTPLTTGVVRHGGLFRIGVRPRSPSTYTVRLGDVVSNAVAVAVRPRVTITFAGARVVGLPVSAVVRVSPAAAGPVTIRVRRGGRLWRTRSGKGSLRVRLNSRRPARYVVTASVTPGQGFVARSQAASTTLRLPNLALGSRGSGVRELEARLRELRFALPRVDGHYGWDTWEAVVAFQKLHGLARTGRADIQLWRALDRARPPRPRYFGGDHIEVDKSRQVLMLVRKGSVALVSHVSTGATGNTPVGRWQVYRKVVGWDWVLWYPMYFLRGFAIHGYPEVPAYPASHGCVRVPMWLAPRLFAANSYGTTIYVY